MKSRKEKNHKNSLMYKKELSVFLGSYDSKQGCRNWLVCYSSESIVNRRLILFLGNEPCITRFHFSNYFTYNIQI